MKTALLACLLTVAASQLHACGAYIPAADYTVHEWGTFTSIQGSDGETVPWESLVSNDLPTFVVNRTRFEDARKLGLFAFMFGKGQIKALQRMETPVVYFYAKEALDVSVTVDFPKGTITEWYPQISKMGPAPGTELTPYIDPTRRDRSFVEWKQVHITPDTTRHDFQSEPRKSHYYAARSTDSNTLKVQDSGCTNAVVNQEEKFLFYRGLGDFASPLKAQMTDTQTVRIENTLKQEIPDIFVIENQQHHIHFQHLKQLAATSPQVFNLKQSLVENNRAALLTALQKALVTAGLYEKEAAAMVHTWEDSWLDEPGYRVLYLLPESWVRGTVPMQLQPAPKALNRVFVGRAELLSPQLETGLAEAIRDFNSHDKLKTQTAIHHARQLSLGRFTQAAFDIVRKNHLQGATATEKKALEQASYELQRALQTVEAKTASLTPQVFSCLSSRLDD